VLKLIKKLEDKIFVKQASFYPWQKTRHNQNISFKKLETDIYDSFNLWLLTSEF
jgi:hypothetical protein